MYDPQKFAAVEDNFIHIHGALLANLAGIIEGDKLLFFEAFPRFSRILSKHSELEDRLFFPELEKRAPGSTAITDAPHQEIEEHLAQLMIWARGIDFPGYGQVRERLVCFERELETHLMEERRVVMPAMMEYFSAEELWALDGRIMEFCSPEFMQEMMPWWFIHMDLAGRVAVARNMLGGVGPDFVPVLCQWISDGLDTEAWLELVTHVPELAQGPTRVEVQVAF